MDNRGNQTKGGDCQSEEWTVTAVQRKHISFNEDVETKWRGDFYFIQGADTQYGLIDRYILKLEKPNWDKEIILTEETVRRVNVMQPKPNFFVVCGDLVDAFPVETPELRKKQEFSFKAIFSKLDKDIPLVCICGNHDVGNQPTYESVQTYRSSFGDDYFSFWSGGIFFICINSQFYIDSSLVPDLIKEQDIWLDKQLEFYRSHIEKNSDANKVGPVLFQHVPWFLNDPFDKETDPYYVVAYDLRIKMLDKLLNAGVKYVFCGHMHRNSGGHYKELESIVTSAIGGQLPLPNDPNPAKSGMRIVKVHKDKITHKYYNIEDLPSEIKPAEETFE